MGPPLRAPSHEHITMQDSYSSPHQPHAQVLRPHPTIIQPSGTKPGMSPTSRYNHNLKVLRRRDPSIISIFDQFSHVCLYHHNGKKWEKQGFEGTMFLYERNAYPPYGFYILNRMGMDDHIQRIYPEDIVTHHGSYCIIKSFPEFTTRRMSDLQSYASSDAANKFSEVYAVPDMPDLKEKERSTIIGLWCFATNEREPLIPVMQRLHSYIKKNIPYPDECRYGPGKPPPPNPNPRPTKASSRRDINSDVSDSQMSNQSDSEYQSSANDSPRPPKSSAAGLSEVDKLFAKLAPTPSASSSTVEPNSTSKMTVASLFAALSGPELSEPAAPPPPPSTGISLLDSIFASASTHSTPAATDIAFSFAMSSAPARQPAAPTTQTESIAIHSPTPSTSHPQVLNQDVISILLGLPPSRAASAASAASTAYSHPSSREGDNEDEGRSRHEAYSDGGFSESSTALDLEAENNLELQAAGASAGIPIVADLLSVGRGGTNGHRRVNGDVTPRPSLNDIPSAIEHVSSTSTVRPSTSSMTSSSPAPNGKPRKGRLLVPFEADSELWPYPRPPLNEGDGDDGEIVELDFADTSALSDVEAFKRVALNGKKNGASREKVRGKKKSRKERDAREREEIERSWDVPETSAASRESSMVRFSSSSGAASPELMGTPPAQMHTTISEMATPTTGSRVGSILNGTPSVPNGIKSADASGKEKKVVRGIDADLVRESIMAAADSHPNKPTTLEKNDFVREVLGLIYTDKAFVNTLWEEYTARLG